MSSSSISPEGGSLLGSTCWIGDGERSSEKSGLGPGAWMEEERPTEPVYLGSAPSDLRRFLMSTVFQPLSTFLVANCLMGMGFDLGSFFGSCFSCLSSWALPLLFILVDCGGGGCRRFGVRFVRGWA